MASAEGTSHSHWSLCPGILLAGKRGFHWPQPKLIRKAIRPTRTGTAPALFPQTPFSVHNTVALLVDGVSVGAVRDLERRSGHCVWRMQLYPMLESGILEPN